MAWQTEMTTILRGLIDDVLGTTYDSSSLENILLIAAFQVKNDVDLNVTYTINVSDSVLDPDPVDGVRDDGFINLVCLKAAHIILRNEAKVKGNQSVSISDGPSSIQLKGRYDAAQKLAEKMEVDYLAAKHYYALGVANPGQAVVGPIPQQTIPIIQGNI